MRSLTADLNTIPKLKIREEKVAIAWRSIVSSTIMPSVCVVIYCHDTLKANEVSERQSDGVGWRSIDGSSTRERETDNEINDV